MKTEITLTIDPTDQNQVAAALALFQKLSGNSVVSPAALTEVKAEKEVKKQVKTEEAPKAEPAVITDPNSAKTGNAAIPIEEVRALVAKKVEANRPAIKAKLTEFGAANVSVLDPSHFSAMLDFLNTLK